MASASYEHELLERRHPQLSMGNRAEKQGIMEEVRESDDETIDVTKSTDNDRYQMERMGKT